MSPVVNVGLQRMRDLIRGSGSMNGPVNSVGFGTTATLDTDLTVDRLGASAGTSYWKYTGSASGAVVVTTGGDGTNDPFVQYEGTWATSEANATLNELGTSAGSLDGTNPAGNDGTKLYTRKKIGPITKTTDISLVGRVKITY